MTISQKGIEMIKQFEGLHDGNSNTLILEPKKDPIGIYTLGFGSRFDGGGNKVTRETAPITMDQAELLLKRDLGIAEATIRKYVKQTLNQNEYDALVSLIFNIGSGNFVKSRLLKYINADLMPAETLFTNWSKATVNGTLVQLPGLLARRKKEYELFSTKVV